MEYTSEEDRKQRKDYVRAIAIIKYVIGIGCIIAYVATSYEYDGLLIFGCFVLLHVRLQKIEYNIWLNDLDFDERLTKISRNIRRH